MQKKIAFLACDLSGYFVACLKQLAQTPDLEIHVVHYPVDAMAPFRFNEQFQRIHFHERKRLNAAALIRLLEQIDPELIICSGWADKGYLRACRRFKNKARSILISDNPWLNSFRQRLATVAGPLLLRNYFDGCWVAGQPQRSYARKLGFDETEICEGCYSCDYPYFHSAYRQHAGQKESSFPRRFIYVGRYIRIKGVEQLWQAFTEFSRPDTADWELWCVGTGDLLNTMPRHEKLKDFGFMQPDELAGFIRKTGVFVMPSLNDHWGVAVHEFATSGFPLICSTGALAWTAFLEEGYNGTCHEPGNAGSLADAFRRISALSDAELLRMGKNSTNLAVQMTPVVWSSIVLHYLTEASLPVFRFDKVKAMALAGANKENK